MVAGSAYEIVQPGALPAQHDHAVPSHIELVVFRGSALVQPDDPQIVPLQVFEGTHQVDYAGDAQMLGCPGAGLHSGGAQRGRAPLGENHAIHPGAVRYTQQRAQILGIFHSIQRQQQPCPSRGTQRLEEILNVQEFLRAHGRENALVGRGSRHLRKLFARLLANPNPRLAARGDQASEAVVVAFARHHHVIKSPPPGTQRLFHRVHAVEDFHTNSVEGEPDALSSLGSSHAMHTHPMPASKPKTFRAKLEPTGDALRWVIARVPFNPAEVWPVRHGRRVRGEINGFAFRTSLFPEAGGKKHVLLVNRKMQAGARAKSGDTVEIRLQPDLEDREPTLPAELQKALKAERGLRRYYDALNPSRRRDIGRWVGEPKTPETRTRRAEQIAERLYLAMDGEREPPPILRAAFQRQPAARLGWEAMTRVRRRNHLFAIFYYQTTEGRERRLEIALEDALKVAKRLTSSSNTEIPE